METGEWEEFQKKGGETESILGHALIVESIKDTSINRCSPQFPCNKKERMDTSHSLNTPFSSMTNSMILRHKKSHPLHR